MDDFAVSLKRFDDLSCQLGWATSEEPRNPAAPVMRKFIEEISLKS
jgi:hypothetical protein